MNENYFEVRYEDLTREFLNNHRVSTIKVIKENVDFYFKLFLKDNSNQLITFSNGAVDRNLKKYPYFQRSKWADDYKVNCIFVDDPSIHRNELRVGFGIGTRERHYTLDISEILITIQKLLDIESKDVIYFGSSAGGYMSLQLATLNIDSLAIVNNARMYVYKTVTFKKISESLLKSTENTETLKYYNDRLSILSFYKKYNNVPNAIHYVNRCSKGDREIHYKPFIANADKYKVRLYNQNFILYSNYNGKHDILSREDTALILNSALDGQLPFINKSR